MHSRCTSPDIAHQRSEQRKSSGDAWQPTNKDSDPEKHQGAAAAAKKRRTMVHLPKSTRTALGKQAASVAKKKRAAKR